MTIQQAIAAAAVALAVLAAVAARSGYLGAAGMGIIVGVAFGLGCWHGRDIMDRADAMDRDGD